MTSAGDWGGRWGICGGRGGRGFQSQWLLRWNSGIEFCTFWMEPAVMSSWGWTQMQVPSASDTLVRKSWNWQTIQRWTVCVNVCILLSHPGFGSQPTQSTPLARHKTGSSHKRMGGLTARGHRSQSRSQHRTHWRGWKFTRAITLLCFLWSHSEGDQVWSASLKFRPRRLLRTMNKTIYPLNTQ